MDVRELKEKIKEKNNKLKDTEIDELIKGLIENEIFPETEEEVSSLLKLVEEDFKYLFDDRELINEEYINKENFKPIVDKENQKEIDNNINKILNDIKIEYED